MVCAWPLSPFPFKKTASSYHPSLYWSFLCLCGFVCRQAIQLCGSPRVIIYCISQVPNPDRPRLLVVNVIIACCQYLQFSYKIFSRTTLGDLGDLQWHLSTSPSHWRYLRGSIIHSVLYWSAWLFLLRASFFYIGESHFKIDSYRLFGLTTLQTYLYFSKPQISSLWKLSLSYVQSIILKTDYP